MRTRTLTTKTAILFLLVQFSIPPPVLAKDRHTGIYYPEPRIHEEYVARVKTLPDVDRNKRIQLVTGLTNRMLALPYPPQFAIFAKGAHAEKMIIVSLHDNSINTLYRARALLAVMTAISRQTPFFRKYGVNHSLTFFDLLVLFGFKQLTVSDGDKFAFQATFKRSEDR